MGIKDILEKIVPSLILAAVLWLASVINDFSEAVKNNTRELENRTNFMTNTNRRIELLQQTDQKIIKTLEALQRIHIRQGDIQ